MRADRAFEIFRTRLQQDVETHKHNLAGVAEWWKEDAQRERRAWEHRLHIDEAMFRAIMDFAVVSIRSLTLINGGAVVAILAFLGSVWRSSDRGGPPSIAVLLAEPLGWFIAGLALAVASAMTSYLSQVAFLELRTEKDGRRQSTAGDVLRGMAIGAACFSLVCFCVGSYQAVQAFIVAAP